MPGIGSLILTSRSSFQSVAWLLLTAGFPVIGFDALENFHAPKVRAAQENAVGLRMIDAAG